LLRYAYAWKLGGINNKIFCGTVPLNEMTLKDIRVYNPVPSLPQAEILFPGSTVWENPPGPLAKKI
jgi:hypothetical protein